MGQEIVYCSRCQSRVTSADLEGGAAFRLADRICCGSCLTPEDRPLLRKREAGTAGRRLRISDAKLESLPGSREKITRRARRNSSGTTQALSSGRSGGVRRESSGSSRAIPVARSAGSGRRRSALALAVAGAAALLLAVVAALLLGGGDRPSPGDDSASSLPETGPTPVSAPSRDGKADALLAEARTFAKADPGRIPEIRKRLEEVRQKYPDSPAATEAARELEGLDRRTRDAFADDLGKLKTELETAVSLGDFRAAGNLLAGVRNLHPDPLWDQAWGDLDRDLYRQTRARLEKLMAQAELAVRGKNVVEFRKIRETIAGWGPDFGSCLETFDQRFGRPDAAPVAGKPAEPELSEAARAYREPWEHAMFLASRRDFEEAGKALRVAGRSLEDEQLRARNAGEIAGIERAGKLYQEILATLPDLPASESVALEVVGEDGERNAIEAVVIEAGTNRFELKGSPRFVEYVDLTLSSMARIYAGMKKDGIPEEKLGALALLCALDGEAETSDALLKDSSATLPETYREYAATVRERLPAPDPERRKKEWEARRLFYAAEREFRHPGRRGAALVKAHRLLDEFADTGLVARSRYEIEARTKAAAETVLAPIHLTGSGIFKTGRVTAKLGREELTLTAWTSPEEPLVEALMHHVEFEFYASPETKYRGWVLLGGCCKTTFTWHLQGTELVYTEPGTRNPVGCDPSSEVAAPWNHRLRLPLFSHGGRDHAGAQKKPERWAWAELPLPTYADGGLKKIRMIGLSKGMAVGPVVVSSVRSRPLDPEELREFAERAEAEDAAAPPLAEGQAKPEQWLVLGPFHGAGIGESLPPENGIRLKYGASVGNGPTEWRPATAETTEENGAWKAKVDFHRLDMATRGVAYAMTHVHAPRDMELTLHYTHDDDMKLYINDALAFEEGRWVYNGKTTIRVKAGWNRLLFKIWDNGKPASQGAFLLEARLTDVSDKPVEGLRFDAYGPLPRE